MSGAGKEFEQKETKATKVVRGTTHWANEPARQSRNARNGISRPGGKKGTTDFTDGHGLLLFKRTRPVELALLVQRSNLPRERQDVRTGGQAAQWHPKHDNY